MPRVSQQFVFDWSTNAGVRVCLAALKNSLISAGLVQTSDTGQIDVTSVAKPTTANTLIGYFIFRFADALQSSAPVFIRITVSTGTSISYAPNLTFRVGAGTDGAGNMTGAMSSIQSWTNSYTYSSGSPTLISYATHSNGFAGLCFAPGLISTTSYGAPTFTVQRICGNTGSPTAQGVVVTTSNPAIASPGTADVLLFLPTTSLTTSTTLSLGMIPGIGGITQVGLASQVFNHFVMTPKCLPLVGTAALRRGETALGQTFSIAMVGTVPKTYLSLGPYAGNNIYCVTSSVYGDLAMLWEA